MKKLFFSLALVCSGALFAADDIDGGNSESSINGIKGFVGLEAATLTAAAGAASISAFNYGIWGGAEFNFIEKLGVRLYVDSRYLPGATTSTVASATNNFSMLFAGNLDLIYRPSAKFGIIFGGGIGDSLQYTSVTTQVANNTNTVRELENNFVTLLNIGVQYNINKNNLIELTTTLMTTWTFTNEANQKLLSANIANSYLVTAKYAYRF